MPELAKFEKFNYQDVVTGDHIRIDVSPYYSTLHVNDRRYYFNREDGKFDGTGTDLTETT